jgi:CheY-like chemotaxis protein
LSPLRFPSDREDSCTDALLLQEPVEMERIRTLLVHGVPTDLQRESPAPAATDVKPRGRAVSAGFSVLLVDDDRSNLVVHQKLLEGMGHTVEAVGNAKAALRSFGHRQFDAAIMDIEMPHMNGWELSSRLREHTAGQHTVLVALTAHDYADIEDRARESSFDAVLSKPASPERIDAVLREHVATRGHSDQELIRKINDAVEAGHIKEATGYLSDLRRATTSAGVAESAFRLLLALRRADTGAIHTLMTKLQKELRA